MTIYLFQKAEMDMKVQKLHTQNDVQSAEDRKIEEMKKKKQLKDEAALEKR